jgi:ribosomal subunit interface protein
MKLNISGKHIEIGSSLRQHIEDHLSRTLDKYFDDVVDATVHVSQERSHVHADISVHVGRGITLRGESTTEDPYHAVEQAIHKIEGNVRRYKNRVKAHHTSEKEILNEAGNYYVLDKGYRNLEEHPEEHHEPVVIAEMAKDVPTLTVSDAVMRMELENKPVLLFKNSAHGQLNAVYIRKDGDIGWMDPHGKVKKLDPKA